MSTARYQHVLFVSRLANFYWVPHVHRVEGTKEEKPSPALKRTHILCRETTLTTRRHEAMPEHVAG